MDQEQINEAFIAYKFCPFTGAGVLFSTQLSFDNLDFWYNTVDQT